jgi:hypothetical protein
MHLAPACHENIFIRSAIIKRITPNKTRITSSDLNPSLANPPNLHFTSARQATKPAKIAAFLCTKRFDEPHGLTYSSL